MNIFIGRWVSLHLRLVILGIVATLFCGDLFAASFKTTAPLATYGQIGSSKNNTGIRIKICPSSTSGGISKSASKMSILIGVVNAEPQAPRNAARLWALYE